VAAHNEDFVIVAGVILTQYSSGLTDRRTDVSTVAEMRVKTLKRSPAVIRVKPTTVLVITDLKGHPRSMIFMSSGRAYATSY